MKSTVCVLVLVLMSVSQPRAQADPPSVLVFSKTTGFRHTSIEPGIAAIRALGKAHGFQVTATEDASKFSVEELEAFAAVVFLSTTGNVLDRTQQRAFEAYVENGGGFVGVHSAADTEYDWPWYGELVGAWFDSHGAIQDATIMSTLRFGRASLPSRWVRRDEWYSFKRVPTQVRVISELDTNSLQDSKHPGHHPIAWHHDVGKGRAFYTGLGHTDESYTEALFLAHLLDGIRYAINEPSSVESR